MSKLNNRNHFAKYILGIFSASLIALASSCDIGLGAAIDLTAPEIKITSHRDNDSVGSVFAIRGTATDNEAVSKITLDFNDADIHYQVIPGGEWQKKTSHEPSWVTVPSDSDYYCRVIGNTIEWSVGVNSEEDKADSKTDNSYTFEAVASDAAGNSGKKSKEVCTIIIDENNPVVSIYKPELATGKWETANTAMDGYKLNDGNTISRLLNGNITLQGRQSGAISFKALRVEFDNGKQQSGVSKYTSDSAVETMEEILELPDASLGDSPEPTVYFAKNIEALDLREWSLTVKPEEWATEEFGLNTGKHLIRVVTTSLSTSNAWERKVLGYFVWYPEADKPWVTAPTGDTEEKPVEQQTDCYPGSDISGSVNDDDGIKSIVSTVYKKGDSGIYEKFTAQDYTAEVIHALPQAGSKYAAWKIKVPALSGSYKYEIKVTDLNNNNTETATRYFKTSDVSAPKIEIFSPLDTTSAILDRDGNLKFNVKATDDGEVTLFALAWLNPALRSDLDNKIKYLTGNYENWKNAASAGYPDDSGNIIYKLDNGTNSNTVAVEKTFNLYNDFNIGGKDEKGNTIPLCSQDFILFASDGNKNTVKAITLSGDNITPEIFTVDSIRIGTTVKTFTNGVPVFASSAAGKDAIITGKWKDMQTSEIESSASRLYAPVVKWGNKTATKTVLNSNGTWTAEVVAPAGGGTITAELTDFGGNKKVVQKAASIETSESGLSRIDCITDDGSYTTGSVINLVLEFTKNVDVYVKNVKPTLTLNNGGTAYYESGSGSTSHVFKYTVGSESDTDNLYVTKINQNGATWTETGSREDITSKVTITAGNTALENNIKTTRKIKIDKTAPKVQRITPLSSSGYFKAGDSVLFKLEFTEDVDITSEENLKMQFAHTNGGNAVKTSQSTAAGSKYVMLTYTVAEGDNANPLAFSGLDGTGVTVKDKAGNTLSDWSPSSVPLFKGFIVDTEKPLPPSFGSWNPGDLVIDDAGTSFTLSIESETTGTTVEYSLDGGVNWLPYSGKVTLTNNGSYEVTARQTDRAGNVSDSTTAKAFVINKGALLQRITASSRSGVYTNSKTSTPNYIEGRIEFRTAVKIENGATVTINVKNGANTSRTIPLEECKSAAAENSIFTFRYEIKDGDSIDSNGKLDVTSWSFEKVNLSGKDVNISFPSAGNGKRFSENRDIKILTGAPAKNGSHSFTGEGAAAVLTIPFNRAIEKGIGDIEIVFDETADNNTFKVPVVLTSDEYGELSSYPVISSNYKAGMNGAAKSGTTLTNDTATKYILDYSKEDTDSDVVAAFKAANKHKVIIPVISDQVQVTGTDSKTLKVTLGETYKLPVKGAKYKVNIPANAVYDEIQNGNAAFNLSVETVGVEAPQIRIYKPVYEINMNANPEQTGTTRKANADMSKAQTAKVKINCRTPGASIAYSKNEKVVEPSNDNQIKDSARSYNTKSADAAVSTDYTNYDGEFSLGDNHSVSTYEDARGLKIALAAKAEKGGRSSAESYEYANRTVLRFVISGQYSAQTGTSNASLGITTPKNESLTFGDLKVWVFGGDAPSGTNTIDPFPLSWGDCKNFKLMQENRVNKNDSDNYYGNFWWVSWDVTAATYHGFVIGDVPSDAATEGPSVWYAGECAWVPNKAYYILYPGETLTMCITADGDYHGANFLFRSKNIGTR